MVTPSKFVIGVNGKTVWHVNFEPSTSSLESMFSSIRFMSGSSYIRRILIGVEYGNFHQTLDVYLILLKTASLQTILQNISS